MRINKKIAGIISVICIGLSAGVANAAQHEINYIKSLDGDKVNISGSVKNGANKDVFIRIDYENKSFVPNTQQLENYVIYQKQTTTDEAGGFEFEVDLEEIGEDMYTLHLGVAGDDDEVSESFVFYGETYRNDAMQAIRAAQRNNNPDALAEAITTYYKNLYIQTPMFNGYYSTDPQLSGIKSILVNYPEIKTISELEAALEGAVMVKDLKECTDYASMEAVFEEYSSSLEISASTIYRITYTGLSDNLKKNVYNAVKKAEYYTADDIEEAFSVAVINAYLKNAVGAGSVKKLLEDNAELFGIDMDDYKLSDSKLLKMLGSEFTSVSGVKDKLDSIKNSSDGNSSGGGSGGGGGGGGGRGGSSSGGAAQQVVPVAGQNTVTGKVNSESYPFTDMESYVWAKEATQALYKSGVLSGVGDDKFAPERVITREEFLKLIINGFEITADSESDVSFGDVDNSAWYYPFVKAGVNSGIINGMDNNLFGIGSKITRQDMVVMLYRAVKMKKELTEESSFCSFEDYDSISDYAKKAVAFAEAKEIVNGMGDGNFHPESNATRAEAAVILYRAIEYLSDNV